MAISTTQETRTEKFNKLCLWRKMKSPEGNIGKILAYWKTESGRTVTVVYEDGTKEDVVLDFNLNPKRTRGFQFLNELQEWEEIGN